MPITCALNFLSYLIARDVQVQFLIFLTFLFVIIFRIKITFVFLVFILKDITKKVNKKFYQKKKIIKDFFFFNKSFRIIWTYKFGRAKWMNKFEVYWFDLLLTRMYNATLTKCRQLFFVIFSNFLHNRHLFQNRLFFSCKRSVIN